MQFNNQELHALYNIVVLASKDFSIEDEPLIWDLYKKLLPYKYNKKYDKIIQRDKARQRWKENLSWDLLDWVAKNDKWETIELLTMKDYIISQCDEYMKWGNVVFDYTHNGVEWCTYFKNIALPDNVHRYWTADDLPQATGKWDHFAETDAHHVNKKHVDVYGRAMMNGELKFTEKIEDWIDQDENWNPNYVKTKALEYKEKKLTITKKADREDFFKRLATDLKLPPAQEWKENKLAMAAYSYIMATVYGWNWLDAIDWSRNALWLGGFGRCFGSDDSSDCRFGVSFSGTV